MNQIETYKVIIVGDSSVGKTSIISRIKQGVFIKDLDPTVGATFVSKLVEVPSKGQTIKL